MRSHDYFEVPIAEVIQEIDTAVSLVLDVPDELEQLFRYKPGQFLTLRLLIGDKLRHRCYSLASAPDIDPRHRITIKRVVGGLVSNFACASLAPGDRILVQPPAGHFVPDTLDGDHLLFAAGSGITPVMSILKSVLNKGRGRVALFYANRDEHSVIFREELAALTLEFPDRFTVIHWLESLLGIPQALRIAPLVAPMARDAIFVCGPEPFMQGVVTALQTFGINEKQIHLERFISLPDEDPADAAAVPAGLSDAELRVQIDGEEHRLSWPRQVKLLDAMLEAGIDAPYSCRVGGCSACMCKIVSGEVRMASNLVLDQAELDEGWVLACQAFAESDAVHIDIP